MRLIRGSVSRTPSRKSPIAAGLNEADEPQGTEGREQGRPIVSRSIRS